MKGITKNERLKTTFVELSLVFSNKGGQRTDDLNKFLFELVV